MSKPRVLIGCEFSGVVRDAFRARGFDAWSCDIIEAEDGGPHMQCDVLALLNEPWNLAIFHPPCTYLTNAGSKHLYRGMNKSGGINPERWGNMLAGVDFFNRLLGCGIERFAIENPIMHRHARERIAGSYSQIIQPSQFGHATTKATCLWLHGLPLLKPTKIIPPDFDKYPPGKGNGYKPEVHYESPGPDRWKRRSRTLPGIAAAMAEQWGAVL